MIYYRSNDAAGMFKVSLRQLQWWDEQRLIEPAIHGHARMYTYEDLVRVGIIAELRDKGMSLHSIRKILRRRLPQAVTQNEYLVCSDQSARVFTDPADMVKAIVNSKSGVVVVAMSDIESRISKWNERGRRAA